MDYTRMSIREHNLVLSQPLDLLEANLNFKIFND